MPTGRESVCCKENVKVAARMEDAGVDCMTDHDGFAAMCLNIHVLEMCLHAYVQEVSPIDDNEPPHR